MTSPDERFAASLPQGWTVSRLGDNPGDPFEAVLILLTANLLGYVRPSDEWVDGTGEPLPEEMQRAAHKLVELGMLPEFEEATRP